MIVVLKSHALIDHYDLIGFGVKLIDAGKVVYRTAEIELSVIGRNIAEHCIVAGCAFGHENGNFARYGVDFR